ncbi:hypothetical protein CEXT_320501 [Caerostris extrusa]|uniref:Uncharacterized protein n=1 Tax=Caerostris extrusa TaxID=172846 RepID=A0AAV4WHS2_CAEEX|nr:hypothetical protein CEXT_320501 [Caerostris extrusa]
MWQNKSEQNRKSAISKPFRHQFFHPFAEKGADPTLGAGVGGGGAPWVSKGLAAPVRPVIGAIAALFPNDKLSRFRARKFIACDVINLHINE